MYTCTMLVTWCSVFRHEHDMDMTVEVERGVQWLFLNTLKSKINMGT